MTIKMSFDISCTTFCQFAIVSIALSCIIFEIFDFGQYRDLKIYVRVTHPAILCHLYMIGSYLFAAVCVCLHSLLRSGLRNKVASVSWCVTVVQSRQSW